MEALNMNDEFVTCCFCGETLVIDEAVLLAVYPTPDREESQGLYAHGNCLSSRLHPSIPRHPGLLPDEV
jgi:hypothetical protein